MRRLARPLRGFAAFWWDFIVGDDWRIAAGVVLALAGTAALVRSTTVPAWWLVPAAVAAMLALSLRRVTRGGRS